MPAEAALLTTWTAVYGFVAAFNLTLWARTRRREPELLTYSLVCVAAGLLSFGGVLMALSTTSHEATLATSIEYASSFAGAALLVEFMVLLTGRSSRRLVGATYITAALGLVLVVSGQLVARVDSSASFFRLSTHALTPLGNVVVLATLALVAAATLRSLVVARNNPDTRVIALGSTGVVIAGLHDLGGRLGLHVVHEWLTHAVLLTVFTFAFVLVRRFVRIADALETRTGELARSYDELRRTQEELVRREQLAAVGELSAVIAHEVRNPLAILKNAVASMRRPTLTKADRGVLLGILDEETDRLNRLVRDLLAYARPVVPKHHTVHLPTLVASAVDRARAARPDVTGITVEVAISPDATELEGDEELLRHALVNVLDNGLHALDAGGTLVVSGELVRRNGVPSIALRVRDDGTGMDELVRSKALDPFFTTRPAGTGLGLAIVGRIVTGHRGSLELESAAGRGTTVTLVLPVAP